MEADKIIRYLVDIGHPAHVHYYKHVTNELVRKGHKVLFTCRNKEFTESLLAYYGYDYVTFGKSYRSLAGKLFGIFYFTLRLLIVAIKYKPDIFINASINSAFVAWILRKPHIALEDTFNKEQVSLYLPFTNCVLTGDYPHPSLGRKELRFKGYNELAYLHPKRFKPNSLITQELGIKKNDRYVIVRFVSWNASHDIGHKGITSENKIRAVNEFSQLAKVFISSESSIPSVLQKYRFPLPPESMHDAIAGASLVFGESATMVSEAAVLGVPGIFLDNTGRYYTKDQENTYGLCFNYTESIQDQDIAIRKGIEILRQDHNSEEWQKKLNKMLVEKIDVTAFLAWFFENWPESFKTMKENPGFQEKFK